ncbi:hypothetical protein [Campylobacter devanensis]|uniref:hypothetical protein n=1 Tax=Campylobacter devanensis TaxID=3161138 RepID=UPI000A34308A|nr:hypothetical protein [Campylobacter sp. P0187]
MSSNSAYMLYYAENETKYTNLKFWAIEFLRLRIRFYILVRDEKLYKKIRTSLTDCVIYAKSTLDVESSITNISNLEAIFYISNHPKNIHSLALNNYKHILLYTNNAISKVFRAYDELWVPSQFHLDNIAKSIPNITDMKTIIIGAIQAQDIVSLEHKSILYVISNLNDFLQNQFIQEGVKYAKQHSCAMQFVIETNNKIDNIFITNYQEQLEKYCFSQGVYCKIFNKISDAIVADSAYIVCDIDSYKDKFLINNIPVYIYKPLNKYIDEDNMAILEFLYIFSTKNEFKDIISKGDFKALEREKLAEYRLGKSFIMDKTFQKQFLQ